MTKTEKEMDYMTENEVQMLLESLIMLAEKSESKEEIIEDLKRIKKELKKKPR